MNDELIYLAGDVNSLWREHVKAKLGVERCLDPTDHELHSARLYTHADLYLVRRSAIILAYYTSEHELALGTSAEVGYGKALDKLIVVVVSPATLDEHPELAYHLDFICTLADVTLPTLDAAIEFIQRLTRDEHD